MLPWSEMDSLQHETGAIQERLVALNHGGLLTINSQPAVNGAQSTDPHVGWGGPNGCAAVPVSSSAVWAPVPGLSMHESGVSSAGVLELQRAG